MILRFATGTDPNRPAVQAVQADLADADAVWESQTELKMCCCCCRTFGICEQRKRYYEKFEQLLKSKEKT